MVYSRFKITVLAIVSCLLWSTAFAGVKIGLEYMSPLQFAGVRFFIAGVLVFPLALKINPGYFRIVRDQIGLLLLFSFLQTFLQYTLFYTGLNLIPAAVAAIVIGSQPLFIAMVAHFMMPGDRMTTVKTAIILLGIGGVVLVSLGKDPGSLTGKIAAAGILLLLAVNVLSGFTNVLVARESGKIPPLVLSSASMAMGGVALFLVSLLLEGWKPGPRPLPFYLSLSWLSILSAVAISIWITLLKIPGIVVSDLNLWKFLIPLSGTLLSWLLITTEKPQWHTIAGMIVITASLVVFNLLQHRNHRKGSGVHVQVKEKPYL